MTVAVTSAVQRRAEITDAIRRETGIDEAMIERLVRGFYRRVRDDALIGPVFAARIGDWEPHLARMCAFWSSVALMTGSYHGQPMQKHLPLPVDAAHFDRWLALFEATARELCPAAGRRSLHRTCAAHRREPRARRRRWARRAAAEGRAPAPPGAARHRGCRAARRPAARPDRLQADPGFRSGQPAGRVAPQPPHQDGRLGVDPCDRGPPALPDL